MRISTYVVIFSLLFTAIAHAEEGRPLVDDKYSLKADRDALDELRKNIPIEVRKENDEKAFMDHDVGSFKKSV
jgi:hypothetical protein